VNRFKTLIAVVLIAGTASGVLLFLVQHFAVVPLIQRAEVYESAGEQQHLQSKEEWAPAEGDERTLFTAATTIMTAIGFAALLFGTATLKPVYLDWRGGALWGLAAFVCVDLAPAFGLPPLPPGVGAAELPERQLWWAGTALCTAIGLWVIFSRKSWTLRLAGLGALILPHAIGAPVASPGSTVPPQLIHQFAIASLLTTAIFWLALGSIGGLLYRHLICETDAMPGHPPFDAGIKT
jgi:cobalt transporter subunit CbtA